MVYRASVEDVSAPVEDDSGVLVVDSASVEDDSGVLVVDSASVEDDKTTLY